LHNANCYVVHEKFPCAGGKEKGKLRRFVNRRWFILDFNIKNLWVVNAFGLDIWITETIFNTWIIMLLLIAIAVVVRVKLRKFQNIPTGFQNVAELAVETFDGFVKKTAGERFTALGNWFFMVFAFILVSNLSGIIGLRPPTADWATTFALALATFILTQVMGLAYRRGKYLKSFFEPIFIFFPLNLIGELSRPISLSFRLFGNVLAGLILTSLVYGLAPMLFRFAFPAALHAVFDLFFGALQTYIFCTLSLTFIGSAASSAE
jgi:F-type H+-transporting ATPase subunit a